MRSSDTPSLASSTLTFMNVTPCTPNSWTPALPQKVLWDAPRELRRFQLRQVSRTGEASPDSCRRGRGGRWQWIRQAECGSSGGDFHSTSD
eukprot:scaffold15944_cov115-Isochrysis_galbana.AAC.3